MATKTKVETRKVETLNARFRVTMVVELPVGTGTFEDALATARTLTVRNLVTEHGELLDSKVELQGVASSSWLED